MLQLTLRDFHVGGWIEEVHAFLSVRLSRYALGSHLTPSDVALESSCRC